jgi:hypothetical protein
MPQECTRSNFTRCTGFLSGQNSERIQQAQILYAGRSQRITERRDHSRSMPPTVCCPLDFPLQQDPVHKLGSNTDPACDHPQRPHDALFMVCKHCVENLYG